MVVAGTGVRKSTRLRDLLYFVILFLTGVVSILYPQTAIFSMVIAVLLGLSVWAVRRSQRGGLRLWQTVLLFTLACYMVLNYGFENIAIHVGSLPLVVSYVLMYACLAMALHTNRALLADAVKEPAMGCILILLFVSSLHLVSNLPAFGIWAIRDCTIFLDGVFFLLGLFWAVADPNLSRILHWMMAVFVINLIYGFTFPWSERILAASPVSGVFLQIPVFGQYHQTAMDLLIGAVFCMGLAKFVIRRHTWILHTLVALQLLGLAILQSRATYIALGAYLLVFVVLREGKKARTFFTLAAAAMVILIASTTLGGIQLSGRIGPVNLSFLEDHIRSIGGVNVTAASSVESRVDFADDVMQHIRAHPIVGEGFGQPLVNYIDDETGAVVRVPHNSHLTIMARLGFVGFVVWLTFNGCLLRRFAYAYLHRRFWDPVFSEFALWSFLYYVVFMIESLVEGPLESPATAIPFYFFTGLTAGVIRLQMAADRAELRATSVISTERHPSRPTAGLALS